MYELKYSIPARLIHWIMAAGFAFMWLCGFTMQNLATDDSSLQEYLIDLHISVGVTMLALLVARIIFRIWRRPPVLPYSIRGWERTLAPVAHIFLYALPATVIALGWAETEVGGHTVHWFGIEIPRMFFAVDENLEAQIATMHMLLAYFFLALAFLHVAAALKHRWIDGHDVIRRMTFGLLACGIVIAAGRVNAPSDYSIEPEVTDFGGAIDMEVDARARLLHIG